MSIGRDLPIAVIGSGLGGLAAASTLASRGHKVILFEANDWIGGKAAVLEENGFRFDMGPTILTLPRVLGRIYAEAGKTMEQELPLIRLDPQWRCFFDDGSRLDLSENIADMAKTIGEFSPNAADAQGYKDFQTLSAQLYEISERVFFWKSINGVMDTISLNPREAAQGLKDFSRLRMGATVAGTIRGKVEDKRVAQMLDHFVQYVGSSPYGSPAVLCSIARMQTDDGIWYPVGGTRAVAEGLAKLAIGQGVEIRTGCEIAGIDTANGKVSAVRTAKGETIPVGAVVSNMDAVRTHRELVGGTIAKRFEARRSYEPACSGVVLYLGLNRRYEHLLHHDFVFSRDPEEEFDWIYRKGEPAPDPSCYIAAPSASDPTVAPNGGEALYVLVHTPYLRPHHDWTKMLPAYRQVILDKLKRTAGLDDIEERIVFEKTLTPQDINDRYRVLNGAIYGLTSHGRFLGAFKPGNRSTLLPGLYLAGGAAHPGPGMPMVMMSGWIAADTLDQDSKAAASRVA